jgi:hypothetical protein
VVVYLEANTKSWPEWRRLRGYENANPRIVAMVNRVRDIVEGTTPNPVPAPMRVTLTGHSGGSFACHRRTARAARVVGSHRFSDSNYSFELRHGDKTRSGVADNTLDCLRRSRSCSTARKWSRQRRHLARRIACLHTSRARRRS